MLSMTTSTQPFHYFISIMMCLLLNGCAVVKTQQHPGDIDKIITMNKQESGASGFSYFLPQKRVKITATATKIIPDELQKKITAAKVGLTNAKKAKGDAEKEVKKQTAFRDQILSSGNAAAIAEAEQKLAEENANLGLAEAAAIAAQATLGNLLVQASEVQDNVVNNTDKECAALNYTFKLELLESEPDPDSHFQAVTIHMPWRDDEFNIVANEKGLLSSTKVTSTDQTSDILIEIAKAISSITGAPSGTAVGRGPQVDEGDEDEKKCPRPFKYENIFDPTFANDVAQVNTDLENLTNPERLFEVEVMGKNLSDPQPPASRYNLKLTATQINKKNLDGLLYRRLLPYIIAVKMKNPVGVFTPIQSALVMLPNEGPVSLLPYKAGPFVKTVFDVEFKDGILTKWDQSKPSEFLAVVRIPIALLKAIISAPAEIIKLRFDLSSENKKLLDAQKAEIEAAKALRDLQDQIKEQQSP